MIRWNQLVFACVSVITFSACHHRDVDIVVAPASREPAVAYHPGPPPHAPAHGYRRKHPMGPEMVFDAGLGVYVVVGQTEVYFDDGSFIRVRHGIFEVSVDLGGPWQIRAASRMPAGLRAKYYAKRGRGHGNPPAKADW